MLRDRFDEYETYYLIGSGVVAIVVALWLQPGLWGYVRRRSAIELFPIRRKLRIETTSTETPLR